MTGYDYASIDGNKLPDFRKLKSNGCSFVIVRGAFTYKGISQSDPHLLRDREPARLAGLRFASYMILGWDKNGPDPETQARTFIRAYGARRDGEMCPWLDLEADSAAALHMTPTECLAWAHRAYDVLQRLYGCVGIYTSVRVWNDVFANASSRMGDGPLWLKVAYPHKAGQPPHPEDAPQHYSLPLPWCTPSSPGCWIVQYQGDAKGVDGFTSTVDCNSFEQYVGAAARSVWVQRCLARANCASVSLFQTAHGLAADGIIGPTTYAALAR